MKQRRKIQSSCWWRNYRKLRKLTDHPVDRKVWKSNNKTCRKIQNQKNIHKSICDSVSFLSDTPSHHLPPPEDHQGRKCSNSPGIQRKYGISSLPCKCMLKWWAGTWEGKSWISSPVLRESPVSSGLPLFYLFPGLYWVFHGGSGCFSLAGT